MFAVGEQVVFGVPADDLGQTLAELPIEEAHHFAHALQREALAPQLANHGDLSQMIHRIQTAVPFPGWLYHSPLVPPLQLASGNSGQSHDVARCKRRLHDSPIMFETIYAQNV